jgi:hypothetical protein
VPPALPLPTPPTGANAANDPGVTGVLVVVGVKVGVMVIGSGMVGVTVRVGPCVGSRLTSVGSMTAVETGVSVATTGTIAGTGVAVI